MNAKIYNGNIQPNHKEYKIWVNDEGVIKTWNGTEWIENDSSGGSGGGDNDVLYYKLTDTFRQTLEEFGSFKYAEFYTAFVICSNFITNGHYENGFFVGAITDVDNNEDIYDRAIHMNGFAVTVPFYDIKGKQFNFYEEYTKLPPKMYERITKEEYFGMITSES